MPEHTHEDVLAHVGQHMKDLRRGMALAFARGHKREHDQLENRYNALHSLHHNVTSWKGTK